jgi:hypothetical protein
VAKNVNATVSLGCTVGGSSTPGGAGSRSASVTSWVVQQVMVAADDNVMAQTIARYGRVALLMINELGYVELDRRGAELLFLLLTEREEKNSIARASNDSFSGWTKTFTDPRLCGGIVDRLTFKAPSSKPGPRPTVLPTPATDGRTEQTARSTVRNGAAVRSRT